MAYNGETHDTEDLPELKLNRTDSCKLIDTTRYDIFLMEKMEHTAFPFIKANNSDAGYDIRSFSDGIINPWGSSIVDTKIKVGLPVGYYGRIASRSGLAVKHHIEVGAGVIDQGYRGEIMVLLRNFSDIPYEYKKGDKIAQFIITPYRSANEKIVYNIEELIGKSDRGCDGFGSTGK